MNSEQRNTAPEPPAAAPETDSLPHPLTFFVSAGERRAILAALRRRHRDRATALRLALNVNGASS